MRSSITVGCLLVFLIAATGGACTSPESGSARGGDSGNAGNAGPEVWAVQSSSREGPGEEIGRITLTDPTGGSPRPARIGTHGIRIVLDAPAAEAEAEAEVRIIYSRQGSADTRSFVAVNAPGEPGVYLGTVDLVAAGEWRIRVRIVGAGGGSAQVTVPEG